mmetsp:Transcript_6742/g.16504  ORF Transcript_6742/g.16504 Transcript_6742/m.16504 type:complete len:291 (-) Transcript_6742:255-1127(-)
MTNRPPGAARPSCAVSAPIPLAASLSCTRLTAAGRSAAAPPPAARGLDTSTSTSTPVATMSRCNKDAAPTIPICSRSCASVQYLSLVTRSSTKSGSTAWSNASGPGCVFSVECRYSPSMTLPLRSRRAMADPAALINCSAASHLQRWLLKLLAVTSAECLASRTTLTMSTVENPRKALLASGNVPTNAANTSEPQIGALPPIRNGLLPATATISICVVVCNGSLMAFPQASVSPWARPNTTGSCTRAKAANAIHTADVGTLVAEKLHSVARAPEPPMIPTNIIIRAIRAG